MPTTHQVALTSTDPEELRRLYQQDKTLSSKLLENVNTPKELILEIIENEYEGFFDFWLAGASTEVLASLVRKVPDLFLPAPKKKFWQRGVSRKGLYDNGFVLLLRRDDIPEEFLIKISTHPSEVVRAAVAAYPNIHASILQSMAKDADFSVALALAKNEASSQEVLLLLSQRKELSYFLVKNPPSCTVESLRESPDELRLYSAVVRHLNTPSNIHSALRHEGNLDVLKTLASLDRISDAILEILFEAMIPELCLAVLRNHFVSKTLLKKVPGLVFEEINKRSRYIQGRRNPRQEDFIKKLLRLLLELPDDCLLDQFRSHPFDPLLLEALEEKTKIPDALAKEASSCVLATEAVLKKLSKHEHEEVRRNVAKNPNVTKEIILQLISEWDPLESTCRHASLSIL